MQAVLGEGACCIIAMAMEIIHKVEGLKTLINLQEQDITALELINRALLLV